MRKLLLLAMTLGLVAAACAGSTEDTTTTAADAATTTMAATTTSSGVDSTTTTESDTTTTSGETAEGTDDCLVGTWLFDTEAFVGNFSTLFQDAGMPDAEVTALDGDYTVEMTADGAFTGTRDGWGFIIESDQGNFTIEFDGTETGTWSADGSTLTVENRSSDIDITATAESGGQEVELPQGQIPIETPEGVASNNDYECSGDVLTLTNSGIETTLNRS